MQEFTIAYRSTKVGLDLITSPVTVPRKTKIVCTLGPACWSEEGLASLLDAGLNVARFNFSHGDHKGHLEVLERVRKVAAEKGKIVACALDTKGPEIRTAMLKDAKDIMLHEGEEVTIVAVGSGYTSWEGGRDPDTNKVTIGLSYDKLCRDVKPGGRVLLADGSCSIQVLEILSDTELRGRVLNSKLLGERKNCNLPGVLVDLPVLGDKDVDDVKNFAAVHNMDLISASFVQSAADVQFIRKVLEEAGAPHIKIISKIESWHGVINYDEILRESDGIMVARGDLAMEIPSEKVALAQKQMITKANIAGKFVVTATQMLESMTSTPLPTRAEMTDVANAVWDGTDAVMLSGETAGGKFPDLTVRTMAAIVNNAELANSYQSTASFIMDHFPKPFPRMEALAASAAGAVGDANASLVVVCTETGVASNAVSKYRPAVPQVVVTDSEVVCRQSNMHFGQYCRLIKDLPGQDLKQLVAETVHWATLEGLCKGDGPIILVSGTFEINADLQPQLYALDQESVMSTSDEQLAREQSTLPRMGSMAKRHVSKFA